jgi:hypothetical protein
MKDGLYRIISYSGPDAEPVVSGMRTYEINVKSTPLSL